MIVESIHKGHERPRRRQILTNWHAVDLSHNLIPYQYGVNLTRTFEPGAIFLGQGDYEFFSLAYLQTVEGMRQDITVLDINDLGKHDIYWKASPAPAGVIKDGRWPLYAAIKKSFMRGLEFIPCGLAYQVLPSTHAGAEDPSGTGLLQSETALHPRAPKDTILSGGCTRFAEYETSILTDRTVYLGHFMQILAANYAFFRVEYLLETDQHRQALRLAHWLMGRNYSPKQVYNNLGSALAERGFNEDAVEAYRLAIARDPLYRSALLNLSSVEKSLGNEAAVLLRRRALRLSPRHHD